MKSSSQCSPKGSGPLQLPSPSPAFECCKLPVPTCAHGLSVHMHFFFFLPSITKDFMSFIIFFFIVKSSSQHHGKSNSCNIPMFQMGQIRAQNEGFPRTLVAK